MNHIIMLSECDLVRQKDNMLYITSLPVVLVAK